MQNKYSNNQRKKNLKHKQRATRIISKAKAKEKKNKIKNPKHKHD